MRDAGKGMRRINGDFYSRSLRLQDKASLMKYLLRLYIPMCKICIIIRMCCCDDGRCPKITIITIIMDDDWKYICNYYLRIFIE